MPVLTNVFAERYAQARALAGSPVNLKPGQPLLDAASYAISGTLFQSPTQCHLFAAIAASDSAVAARLVELGGTREVPATRDIDPTPAETTPVHAELPKVAKSASYENSEHASRSETASAATMRTLDRSEKRKPPTERRKAPAGRKR